MAAGFAAFTRRTGTQEAPRTGHAREQITDYRLERAAVHTMTRCRVGRRARPTWRQRRSSTAKKWQRRPRRRPGSWRSRRRSRPRPRGLSRLWHGASRAGSARAGSAEAGDGRGSGSHAAHRRGWSARLAAARRKSIRPHALHMSTSREHVAGPRPGRAGGAGDSRAVHSSSSARR